MASQRRASGIFGRAQGLADRVVSPGTRQNVYDYINTFFKEQPFLASFLATQIILSFLPVALFLSFLIGILLLSCISALFFSIFWIGIALLVLVPTLFVTLSLGLGFWIWAATSFVLARKIYNFLPGSTKGTAVVGLPNGKKVVISKPGGGPSDVRSEVIDGT